MDEWISRLEALTNDALGQLEQMEAEDFECYVDEREEIIDAIKSLGVGPNEKALFSGRIHAVLSYDAVIQHKMNQKLQEAKQGLNKMRAAKSQRSAYESPYAQESYFVDHKK